MNKVKLKALLTVEVGCIYIFRGFFRMAVLFEDWSFKFAKLQGKSTKPVPSMQQWINRLIEFIDSRYIVDVYNYFIYLVSTGVEPDDAFTQIIEAVQEQQ